MNEGPSGHVARKMMRGAITAKDVILEAATIVRLWGPAAYLRCLRAALSRRPSTFLDVLRRSGALRGRG